MLNETTGTTPEIVPGKPAPSKRSIFFAEDGTPRIWTLWYSERNRAPQYKSFIFEGKMREAILRGRAHCDKMDYRFVQVRPFVIDLDYQEKQYTQGQFRSEGEDI